MVSEQNCPRISFCQRSHNVGQLGWRFGKYIYFFRSHGKYHYLFYYFKNVGKTLDAGRWTVFTNIQQPKIVKGKLRTEIPKPMNDASMDKYDKATDDLVNMFSLFHCLLGALLAPLQLAIHAKRMNTRGSGRCNECGCLCDCSKM